MVCFNEVWLLHILRTLFGGSLEARYITILLQDSIEVCSSFYEPCKSVLYHSPRATGKMFFKDQAQEVCE